MKESFSDRSTLLDSWVFTTVPAKSMSAAAPCGNTLLRYLSTRLPYRAIPAKAESVWTCIVCFNVASVSVTHGPVCLIEYFVGVAFRTQRYKTAKMSITVLNQCHPKTVLTKPSCKECFHTQFYFKGRK